MMNWEQVQGSWKQFSGSAKIAFNKLTDDDLAQAAGSREKLEGIIQKRYGYAKDEVKTRVDQWMGTLH